jgi:hypothetical protein
MHKEIERWFEGIVTYITENFPSSGTNFIKRHVLLQIYVHPQITDKPANSASIFTVGSFNEAAPTIS